MNILTVQRYYHPDATLGYSPELDLWTIERPWLDNKSGVSCVPEGEYELRRHSPTSTSLPKEYDFTFAMVNEALGVSHYQKAGCVRSVCLFGHIANYSHEVRGCIGFGTGHAISGNILMVTNSRLATKKALDYIVANKITKINITHFQTGIQVEG